MMDYTKALKRGGNVTHYRDTYACIHLDYIQDNVETLYQKFINHSWLSLKPMLMDMVINRLRMF